MPIPVIRTNMPLIRFRMNEEQRTAYALALRFGAKQTAAWIRASKANVGPAIVLACREVGTPKVVEAFLEAKRSEWSACAIRYAPGITEEERGKLSVHLTAADIKHAKWALGGNFIPQDEQRILLWMSNLVPAAA